MTNVTICVAKKQGVGRSNGVASADKLLRNTSAGGAFTATCNDAVTPCPPSATQPTYRAWGVSAWERPAETGPALAAAWR